MSTTSNGDQDVWVSLNATSSFEDDDEALESLVELKEADFGELFTGRDTNLDSDDDEGISILFYSEDTHNSLRLSLNDEGDLVIYLSLSVEDVDNATMILNRLLDPLESITPRYTNANMEFDVPFESLDLPITDDSDFDVSGIKLSSDGNAYVIISVDGGGIRVNHRYDEFETVEEEFSDEFMTDIPDRIINLVEEELT